MHGKAAYQIVFLLLLFAGQVSQGEMNPLALHLDREIAIQQADSLYAGAQYQQALHRYATLNPLIDDPRLEFKIAYALFRTGNKDSSAKIFGKLAVWKHFLPEYSRYFYIRSMWEADTAAALEEAVRYIAEYNRHTLADSLLAPVAEAFFNQNHYTEARRYFLKAKENGVRKEKNGYFLVKSAMASYYMGNRSKAFSEFKRIIKKYPSSPAVYELVIWLEKNEPDFYKENFFTMIPAYAGNRQYLLLRKKLETFIKQEKDKEAKAKARFELLKVYYAQGRYRTVLYGMKELLKDPQAAKLEPHIRLYVARSYLRLGRKRNAIQAYTEYAKSFPRRRKAPEALWKAAWIYEEQKRPEEALKLYREVSKRWKRSEFTKEAQFREGFSLFRLKQYQEADQVFTRIRFSNWPDFHRNRAQYWSAVCRDLTGDTLTARRLRTDLAGELWDDYYTMKSYLLDKEYIDDQLHLQEKFHNSSTSLSYYAVGFANLIDAFEKAFLVRDLLGHQYGLLALKDIKLSAKTREEWIALAEIYKKFGDYGKAYRVYEYINRKYYNDRSYVLKPFILKERFPFYYDNEIEKYAKRYGLEKELILAVIKQESKYEPGALSWANAWGLMQLIPSTAKDMARLAGIRLSDNRQLYDPELNIHLGSLYLKQLARQFNGRKEWMLAAYNAGPHRVKRWRKIPGSERIDVFIENIEFSETRDYVRKVMKNYWAYKLLANNFQVQSEQLIFGVK
ncbi:MAG TPA: tetratricopeptide repeat protein [Caldithrix abyssi]|uniref:Tetratricopeptide repeat protein n=1 Tax=Caldithrix abyssi TaxID=187145 RepID=A0A7V4U146_CALAY|nr:tetratricopeptide repeat protein [Caldithrix abyssi]